MNILNHVVDLCVLGAGAAGLMAGAEAARRGRTVVLLDHGPRVGRKVLISGGGRCNLTNVRISAEHYLSDNPHFCKSALAGLGTADLLERFTSRGLEFVDEDRGKLFCRQGAGAVAKVLEDSCREAGADIRLSRPVTGLKRFSSAEGGEARFVVDTPRETLACRSVLVALGGPAWPGAGASSRGLDLARELGLPVIPPRPALVPLTMGANWPFAELAGIALPVRITCGQASFQEALLFTHRGLSGPAALQVSAHAVPGQDQMGREVVVDLLPGTDLAALLADTKDRKVLLKNFLARLLPQRLAQLAMEHLLPPGLGARRVGEIGAKDLRLAAQALSAWTLAPSGTEGWAKAEVTARGVDTRPLSSRTMECKAIPGLYFAGEVLDVTGQLGGYNLHWALASGLACGRAV